MTKSCLDCPSFVQTQDTARYFGRSLGVPRCARFGTPLYLGRDAGRPELQRRTMEELAEKCTAHGQFRPTAPISDVGLIVGTPDPAHIAMGSLDESDPLFKNVSACTMCKHFTSEAHVTKELGWTAGLCKMRGKLIPSSIVRTAASNCTYRAAGVQSSTTDGVELFERYDSGGFTTAVIDPISGAVSMKVNVIEPHEYVTDQPVSDEDRANGIRAWRRIYDPDNVERYVHLPVFDPEFFSEDDQKKIPRTGDDEHPELYRDHAGLVYTIAVMWRELDETPALWGEAGVGKTELGRHLAWLMCLPFERISITASSEVDDLAGKNQYDNDRGTYFQFGRVPKAWSRPCVLIVDEPNTGPPEVWQFLRPMTDNSKQLVLDMADGREVDRHDACHLLLAMNPSWDPRNRGAEEIADADASRLMHIFMELPPPEIEREIIQARVRLDGWEIPADTLDMVMKIAEEIRPLCKDGTIPSSWGIRPQIQVARALRWFEPVIAYRRAAADYMEPEGADALLDVVRSHAPSRRR